MQFADAAEQLRRRSGALVLSEAVLRSQGRNAIVEGVLGLPVRLDLVSVAEGAEPRCLSVNSERLLTFDPVSFVWSEGLRVALGPFQWDSLTVRIPAPVGPVDWKPLVAWFREWFREEEDGAGEPLGVVHFLSDPDVVGGAVRFTADLGSAPVEAFEGLLDAFVALGVPEVTIGGAA